MSAETSKRIRPGLPLNLKILAGLVAGCALLSGGLGWAQTQTQTTERVQRLFTLPEHDLYPESIAYDTQTGCYFLGSMSTPRILRITADGVSEDFTSPDCGLVGSVGLKADPERRRLWVCSGRFALHAQYDTAPARTGVFLFDLDTGALIRKWEQPRGSAFCFENSRNCCNHSSILCAYLLS